jgi:diguanylate cyclase (GGDEF)-like protein
VSDDSLDPRLAERLVRATRAAKTLSETLWEALEEELSNPRSQRVAELSEQLGVLAAVVASLAHADVSLRESPVAIGERESRRARVSEDAHSVAVNSPAPAPSASPAPTYARVSRESFANEEPSSQSPAVLVDELAPTPPEPRAQETSRVETRRPGEQTGGRAETRPPESRPQIEIRDERGEDGPVAWIGAIGRRLERFGQDSSPFAVLLVELVDFERLRQAESAEELSRLMSQLEEALARGLRPADALTREGPGRYWLLAPQTDAAGARVLAQRIARGVRSSASHRGIPLEVAVGIAVCPDDGSQASELAAHADVGLYAARAAGRYS